MIGIIRKLSYSEIKVDAKYPNSKGMILVKSKSVMTEQELEASWNLIQLLKKVRLGVPLR